MTEPGLGGKARRAGMGGRGRPSSKSTCITFTLSSLQHLLSKKPNKRSMLDRVHKCADYTWSFYKAYSFPHISTCRNFSTGCKAFHNCLSLELDRLKQKLPNALPGFKKELDS